jgi:hypothetical protein
MRSLAAWKLPLLAILCAAGMWTYADRVLIPHQVSDAAAHGWPRGNLSDLYKQWIGAQELLLHGRDPYSAEVTREIQAGYYGRPLDPDRRTGQNYEQAFSYPVYVAFYLAPTIHLPFEIVRKGCFWVLFGLTVATIPLWPRVLRWSVPLWGQVSLVVFTLGSLPVMQGLKLQQITLFVVPLLAVAMALLVSDRPVAGIGYHQAAAGLAVIGLVDDLDRRRLAPSLSLGRVVSCVHGHSLGNVGVVSATLGSPLLAGGSRIPQLHGRDVGDGRTGRLSLEPGA